MAKAGVPKYFGLRIYLSSSILLFFLIFPFFVIIGFQSVPKFMAAKERSNPDSAAMIDSLGMALDSIQPDAAGLVDSLDIVGEAIALGESFADSIDDRNMHIGIQISEEEHSESDTEIGNDGPLLNYFLFLFLGTFVSYLVGFLYNRRFKKYFRLSRRKREIPQNIEAYCNKHLFRTPWVNSFIVILPNLALIIYSVIAILAKNIFDEEVERGLFIQLFYLTLVATLLEFLFVFYWQKHRVHIKYIDHIFSPEELRVQIFRNKRGKIRNRFLIASGMTTFLPLMIVTVYLILSFTSLKSLDMESMNQEQKEILIGPWAKIFNSNQEEIQDEKYQNLFYVNAIDSIVMLAGIGSGIVVSLIYLLLFIRWTNKDISVPLKELLANIRNTRGGATENFTIVRTSDEIGELAEGYNEMTAQIHDHVERISKMNRNLEATVKERTGEVVMQKEEIEAQKEEIEAQLDLATSQRDTITRQKDQILDSIRYAERIQSAILPPIEHLSDYLTDHFILFKPRDIVSGDYYWTTQKDDKIMIAVADCTGHGVPGAFLSMLGISSMNEIVNRNESIHANQILEQLRDFVITSLHQTGSMGEAQDGIEIALCVIDTRKKVMEYAGANRPLYIVRKKGKDTPSSGKKGKSARTKTYEGNSTHQLKHIRGDKMPIGIYDQENFAFTNHEISLERGDSLYLFSDGYVDQLGGPSRKTFRSRYFRRLLLKIQDQSMEGQKQVLVEELESWRGEVEQIDDILVIGIKI